MDLIRCLTGAGVRRIVFTGGDPSLRGDLAELVMLAKEQNMTVDIHTNAHCHTTSLLTAIAHADSVGLSLDGASIDTHDAFRNKPGNFVQVTKLLSILDSTKIPVDVRTIVTRQNINSLGGIGEILRSYTGLRRWSLMEFTALGEGRSNRALYELDCADFQAVASAIAEYPGESLPVDIYRNADKEGTYALISSDGTLYGVASSHGSLVHRRAGSLLQEHLSVLVGRLPFLGTNHHKRYG